jgi:hypothetical protein
MRFLPFKPQAFSAVVSVDTSFGYFPSERDDIQSLKEVREVLSQDDELIVDVFNRERLILKYKPTGIKNLKWAFVPLLLKPNRLAKWMLFRFLKWKEYPSFLLLQKRKVDSNGERLHDLWMVYDKAGGQIRLFEHTVRLYGSWQLQRLLETAGFRVNAIYGDYEGQRFSPNSRNLILVANPK